MPKATIDLTLIFTSPPCVGEGGTRGTLADKTVTRNAQGQFVIPASHVKGKLRHACEQLLRAHGVAVCRAPRAENMCPNVLEDDGQDLQGLDGSPVRPDANGNTSCLLCGIFGSPASASRLRFHDLVVEDSDSLPRETLRPMVSLNRFRRVAEAQRLFLFETAPNVPGLTFREQQAIMGNLDTPAQLHLLLAGLQMLSRWGGGASRGLGWGKAVWQAQWDGQSVDTLNIEEVRRLCPSSL